jgi:hypothetical protein
MAGTANTRAAPAATPPAIAPVLEAPKGTKVHQAHATQIAIFSTAFNTDTTRNTRRLRKLPAD